MSQDKDKDKENRRKAGNLSRKIKRRKLGPNQFQPGPHKKRSSNLPKDLINALRKVHESDRLRLGENERAYRNLWKREKKSPKRLYFNPFLGKRKKIFFSFDEEDAKLSQKFFKKELFTSSDQKSKKQYQLSLHAFLNRLSDQQVDILAKGYFRDSYEEGTLPKAKKVRLKELISLVFSIPSSLEKRIIENQDLSNDRDLLNRRLFLTFLGIELPYELIDIITSFMPKDRSYLDGFGCVNPDFYKAALFGWDRLIRINDRNYLNIPRLVVLMAKEITIYPVTRFSKEEIRMAMYKDAPINIALKKLNVVGGVNKFNSALRMKPVVTFPYLRELLLLDYHNNFALSHRMLKEQVKTKNFPKDMSILSPEIQQFFQVKIDSMRTKDTVTRVKRIVRILSLKTYPMIRKLSLPATYYLCEGVGADRCDLLYQLDELVVFHEDRSDNVRGTKEVFISCFNGQKKTLSDKPNDYVWKLTNLKSLSLRCNFLERDLAGIPNLRQLTKLSLRFNKIRAIVVNEVLKELGKFEVLRRLYLFLDDKNIFAAFKPKFLTDVKNLQVFKIRFERAVGMYEKLKTLIVVCDMMEKMIHVEIDMFSVWGSDSTDEEPRFVKYAIDHATRQGIKWKFLGYMVFNGTLRYRKAFPELKKEFQKRIDDDKNRGIIWNKRDFNTQIVTPRALERQKEIADGMKKEMEDFKYLRYLAPRAGKKHLIVAVRRGRTSGFYQTREGQFYHGFSLDTPLRPSWQPRDNPAYYMYTRYYD